MGSRERIPTSKHEREKKYKKHNGLRTENLSKKKDILVKNRNKRVTSEKNETKSQRDWIVSKEVDKWKKDEN